MGQPRVLSRTMQTRNKQAQANLPPRLICSSFQTHFCTHRLLLSHRNPPTLNLNFQTPVHIPHRPKNNRRRRNMPLTPFRSLCRLTQAVTSETSWWAPDRGVRGSFLCVVRQVRNKTGTPQAQACWFRSTLHCWTSTHVLGRHRASYSSPERYPRICSVRSLACRTFSRQGRSQTRATRMHGGVSLGQRTRCAHCGSSCFKSERRRNMGSWR